MAKTAEEQAAEKKANQRLVYAAIIGIILVLAAYFVGKSGQKVLQPDRLSLTSELKGEHTIGGASVDVADIATLCFTKGHPLTLGMTKSTATIFVAGGNHYYYNVVWGDSPILTETPVVDAGVPPGTYDVVVIVPKVRISMDPIPHVNTFVLDSGLKFKEAELEAQLKQDMQERLLRVASNKWLDEEKTFTTAVENMIRALASKQAKVRNVTIKYADGAKPERKNTAFKDECKKESQITLFAGEKKDSASFAATTPNAADISQSKGKGGTNFIAPAVK